MTVAWASRRWPRWLAWLFPCTDCGRLFCRKTQGTLFTKERIKYQRVCIRCFASRFVALD